MKETPEFCAGVKILIERMETNPEDFEADEYDYASMRKTKQKKFSHIAKMLDALLFGPKEVKADVMQHWKEWGYLSKEEQDALMVAYKKLRRGQFDKQIMERVFDEKFYERQDEQEQMWLQQEAMRRQMLAKIQIQPFTTTTTQPGQFHHHPAQNSLLGSIGSALGLSK